MLEMCVRGLNPFTIQVAPRLKDLDPIYDVVPRNTAVCRLQYYLRRSTLELHPQCF